MSAGPTHEETDLVAPFDCLGCEKRMLATPADMIHAAGLLSPGWMVCPWCGKRLGIKDIAKVAFFRREEWEGAPDDKELDIDVFYIDAVIPMPQRATS